MTNQSSNHLLKAHMALLILNVMYGINYLLAKGLMPAVIGPNGFILLRVGGAVILFSLVYIFKFEKVKKADFLLIALCGLFGVAINQLFFFNGLNLTSPVNASVIMVTTPIIVLVMSVVIVKEKMRPRQVLGVLIGAIAAIIFTSLGKTSKTANLMGDIFIFLNAVSYALYLILAKPLMKKYKPLTVITWVFIFGLAYVICWPFSIWEARSVNYFMLSYEDLSKIIFVIIGVTFLPYLLTVYAMKYVSATITSIYIYIQPVLAALFILVVGYFGGIDYRADFSVFKIICTIFIFVGVYLVIKPPKEKEALYLDTKKSD